jgi:inner membrane protein
MLFRTHLAVAVLISIILLFFNINLFFIIIFLIASLLPDIDHPGSKLGKRFKFLNMFFQHRGFFHSLIAMVLFTFLISLINFNLAMAFFLGYILHLLLDSFTKSGIYIFYPFSLKKSKGKLKVGSLAETFIFIILLIIIIAMLIFYIF